MSHVTAIVQLLYVVAQLVGTTCAELTRIPTAVSTVRGSTVVLPCSTNLDVPVLWMYDRAGADENWQFVHDVDKVQTDQPRFRISRYLSEGQYNLTITDVQLEDAGRYRCVDDEGYGYDLHLDGIPNNVATAQLSVTDNQLRCGSKNSVTHLREKRFYSVSSRCSLISMYCSINFIGSMAPIIEWTLMRNVSDIKGISLESHSCNMIKTRARYRTVEATLTLSASAKLNQSYVRVQITDLHQLNDHPANLHGDSKLIWRSEKINIQADVNKNADTSDCTPTLTIKHNTTVYGVTVVDDEIFVVRYGQSQVNVYDSHSLRASRDINIPDMKRPESLAGCAYNRALYISDWELKCIHRVDLTNNFVIRWEMRENYLPLGLSVTAEHTLLVTVRISGTEGESRVVEYTSEGQQVREIRFDGSIEWAWHTVQLSSDQFIVSHGVDSSLNRVCVINAEGQIIKSFGREKGGGEDQLHWPHSLAIDEKSKHVFVADVVNRRVLMLDSELMTRLGEVHVSRDLEWPYRLYFDSSTDRLFVAEHRSYSPCLFVVTRPELRN